MSRENSPVIQLNFDADDIKEDKENEENFGPDGFKDSEKDCQNTKIRSKIITPRKDYKEK